MSRIISAETKPDDVQIEKSEQELGCIFPADYRAFLTKYNGGYPEPDGFDFNEGQDGSSVDYFLGITEEKNRSVITCYNLYNSGIPQGFYPIAKDPGGNLILADGGSKSIFFWDHNFEAEAGKAPDMSNVYKIADTFTDFMNLLYEIEI